MGLLTLNGRRRLFEERNKPELFKQFAREYGVSQAQAREFYTKIDRESVDANMPPKNDRLFGGGKLLQKITDFLDYLGTPEGQARVQGWITAIKFLMAAFGGLAVKVPPAPKSRKK